MTRTNRILAVDDELFNLDIMSEYLTDAGYTVVQAQDGVIACDILKDDQNFDVILLDRMMPNLSGIEVLKKLKASEDTKNIPIVLQTAAAESSQIREGIELGAYYYLTKPYDKDMLLTIVKSACDEHDQKTRMQEEAKKQRHVLGLMQKCSFKFRTLEEAQNLSYFLSNCYPEPERVVYGISEILVNAIEHGNLDISYSEKSQIIRENRWQDEIARRLAADEYKNKVATVSLDTNDEEIILHVVDEGKGFDWQNYLDFDPTRATDPNGRGIAMAKTMSFDSIEYKGKGNDVTCRTFKNQK
jgi:CheY-like chemotaxis protein/anti-sigma regulatory factor (Ser/Thr protein kinase)